MAIDGRTEVGRRLRDLAESFAVQLGGWAVLSDLMAAAVRRAAELTALAEVARAAALCTGNLDPVGLVRLEGAAARAVRALGLDGRQEPAGPSLAQYLAEHYAGAEQADEEPNGDADEHGDAVRLVLDAEATGDKPATSDLPEPLSTSNGGAGASTADDTA